MVARLPLDPRHGRSEPVGDAGRRGVRRVAVWRIEGDGREVAVRQALQPPSFLMVRDAAMAGAGVARLPQVLVADDLAAGRLVCWVAADEPPFELWALHLSRRYADAKVKALLQAFDAAFPTEWL